MEEIHDNLYMVTLPMPFRLMHVQAFIAVDGDEVTLLDTGFNTPETFVLLEESLQKIGKDVRDIKRIFITHYHIDHCGMAGRLQDISGARIHMSEQSRPFILRRESEEFLFADRIRDFCLLQGLPEQAANSISGLFLTFKKGGSFFHIDEFFPGTDKYIVGGEEMQVIPTPGHTHDHVSFYFPQRGILLAGDHVLSEITPNLSPDLFAPEFRPLRSYLESLASMESLSVAKVYPAHGRPFRNLQERIAAIYDHHLIRKRIAYESVQKGVKTAFEVSQDIFGTELTEFDQFLALNETYVHLLELIGEGLIREERRAGQAFYIDL
jgi:glyoxylase-like metal-dependent hydrolase (beta-lactamase superfamily II)